MNDILLSEKTYDLVSCKEHTLIKGELCNDGIVIPNVSVTKVICTKIVLTELDIDNTTIVALAEKIASGFPVQSYSTYHRTLYLTFYKYLSTEELYYVVKMKDNATQQ